MDGILLETVEGLGHSPFVSGSGEIWQRLQAEKEELNRDLLTDISPCATDVGGSLESEASEDYAREIEWRHRAQMEARLRDINDAQDRLMDGAYGRCIDCGEEIESERLTADPAASRCIACQRSIEIESTFEGRPRRALVH